MEVLSSRVAPMTAYEILNACQSDERRLAPTTVYRALAALTENGAVHRLESRNAYVACRSDCAHKATVFTVCDQCGAAAELASRDVLTALTSLVGAVGFVASRQVIEVFGRCAACESLDESS